MKAELTTSIITAVVGALIAYFVCNIFVGAPGEVTFKTVESVDISLEEPNPEVFNYKALNPTVEVYVGDGEEEP